MVLFTKTKLKVNCKKRSTMSVTTYYVYHFLDWENNDKEHVQGTVLPVNNRNNLLKNAPTGFLTKVLSFCRTRNIS